MKRIAALLLFLPLLSACTSDKDKKNESVTTAEISAAIIESGEFPEMVNKTVDDLKYFYSEFDFDNVAEASFYVCPSGAYADNITVIKMKSVDDAKMAKIFFEDYIKSEIESWRNYQTKEAIKMEDSIVEQKGEYIGMFICQDSEKAKEIFVDHMQA